MAKRKYNICYLSTMHAADDKRVVDKEIRSTVSMGYSVLHICPDHQRQIFIDGLTTDLTPAPKSSFQRLMSLPRLYFKAMSVDAQVYHCNEVDSWLVGVLVKFSKLGRPKVIFDAHEDYTGNTTLTKRLGTKITLIVPIIRLYISIMSRLTDYIILAKDSIAVDYRAAGDRICTVNNYTTRSESSVPTPAKRPAFTFLHLGQIAVERGWPQLLDALVLVKKQHPEVSLLIIGEFVDKTQPQFEARTREYGLEANIQIKPWMPYEQMMAESRSCHAGLVLFQPGIPNHIKASPHKLFDYMKASLPIIAPDFAVFVAQTMQKSQAGILVDPSSPQQIADAMLRFINEPELCTKLGTSGLESFINEFNWESQEKILKDVYTKLIPDHSRTSAASLTT